MGGKHTQINPNGKKHLERHIHTTFLSRTGKLFKRKAPLAVLVALGGVGDADARGGGELDARAVAFKPTAKPRADKRFCHRHRIHAIVVICHPPVHSLSYYTGMTTSPYRDTLSSWDINLTSSAIACAISILSNGSEWCGGSPSIAAACREEYGSSTYPAVMNAARAVSASIGMSSGCFLCFMAISETGRYS